MYDSCMIRDTGERDLLLEKERAREMEKLRTKTEKVRKQKLIKREGGLLIY